MKTLEIKITDSDKDRKGSYNVITEENRGSAGWNRLSSQDGTVNGDTLKVNILGNQRIVIDPFPQAEVKYDRDQGAAFSTRMQRNEEGRTDSALDKMNEEDQKKADQKEEQERARLKEAEKLQGGPVPPPGQATPPASFQAAQPSAGPSGEPLEADVKASASGPETVQEPRSKILTPEQEEKKEEEEAKAVETAEKQAADQRTVNAARDAAPVKPVTVQTTKK